MAKWQTKIEAKHTTNSNEIQTKPQQNEYLKTNKQQQQKYNEEKYLKI